MQKRRVDGKNGNFKGRCGFSRTGWAWRRVDRGCTCKPCTPPKNQDRASLDKMALKAIEKQEATK